MYETKFAEGGEEQRAGPRTRLSRCYLVDRHVVELPCVRLLSEKGADSTVTTKYEETPLYAASLNGHEACGTAPLRERRRCGRSDATIVASLNGHEAVVRLLFEKGADASVANKDGVTPLYVASLIWPQGCGTAPLR
jgi:hypothetical protein